MNKIYIIGIGYRPLEARASELVLNAETILASKRLYEVFTRYKEFESVNEKIMVINKIDETMEFLRSSLFTRRSSLPLVLLASGDPLFFGIGRRILDEFGPDLVEVLPDLSSIQLAFSRIKDPWDNAFLMSLHGGPDPEKRRRLPYEIRDIPALLEKHGKVAILTDRENNPAAIAKTLLLDVRNQESEARMFVCEKLGYDDEKIVSGKPEEIAAMSFDDPNVVVIKNRESRVKNQTSEHGFGLTESEISHSRGLITKDEVRAVSIHKLGLPRQGVFWDIGAGSGSVSVEAARMHPGLRIYAIEKSEEQIENIRKNIIAFGLQTIEVVPKEAPEALAELPHPDRVFIGGSGGRLADIIACVMQRLRRGIIVLNAISLDTLNDAVLIMSDNGLEPEVSQISVSRTKIVNGQRHMSALNPIFVVKGEKR